MIEKEKFELIFKEWKRRKPDTGIERDILKEIMQFIDIDEILTISGVRRCGKTTLMFQIINSIAIPRENILYFNFEDERLIQFTVEDFDRLLESFYEINSPKGKIFLFLDEIQEVKNWEKWVRRIYDSSKDIKMIISGSNSSLLSSEFSSLLTGRNLNINIYPFSFNEALLAKEIDAKEIETDLEQKARVIKAFKDYLNNGGFPKYIKDKKPEVLQQYFKDIIFRDILKRYKIRDISLIEELYLFLLANVSNLITYSKLKNIFRTGIDTIREYISYGKNSNLIFEMGFFSYSLKESIYQGRKIYCIDNGLRNSVCFKFSKDEGRLAENMIFIDLKRRGFNPHYWKKNQEVDFVVKRKDNSLVGLNICYSNSINDREIKGLLEFKKEFKSRVKELIIVTKDRNKKEEGIRYIPLWKFALEGIDAR